MASSSASLSNKLHSAPQNDELSNAIANGDDGPPIILHPLVVLNVSDHFTRYAAIRTYSKTKHSNQAQSSSSASPFNEDLTDTSGNPRVIGLLLGTQRGRFIEVCHSFELKAKQDGDKKIEIDLEFMQNRIEQYQQIFSQYIIVGWYTTGTEINESDLKLHEEKFTVLNETPILLLLNSNNKNMITIYQMELKVINDKPKKVLIPISHRYASEDSERIAVDHIIRHGNDNDGISSTISHLNSLRSSIHMLHNRLQLILKFLVATVNQEIPIDYTLLRQVSSVCSRLPALDSLQFSNHFDDEKIDSLLISYLGGITKTLCSLHDALDMFNRLNVRTASTGPPRRRSAFSRS